MMVAILDPNNCHQNKIKSQNEDKDEKLTQILDNYRFFFDKSTICFHFVRATRAACQLLCQQLVASYCE